MELVQRDGGGHLEPPPDRGPRTLQAHLELEDLLRAPTTAGGRRRRPAGRGSVVVHREARPHEMGVARDVLDLVGIGRQMMRNPAWGLS